MTSPHRQADHPVEPIFTGRWSRRSFAREPVSPAHILSLFEAARWAPSARNVQPWHFLYARQGGPDWDIFLDLIYERNRVWAKYAGALVAILSRHQLADDGELKPWRTHAFDTGAAWANMALQASRIGLNVRAMGGFDQVRARTVLDLPPDLTIHVMVAVGWPGAAGDLPVDLRGQEAPNGRRAISEFTGEGRFRP